MPTPTYDLISEQTPSGVSTVTFGSGGTLPQTYRDLVLEFIYATAPGGNNISLNFNGDSGTNYSETYIAGNGTTASSGRDTNAVTSFIGAYYATSAGMTRASIMSYSNSSTYKTILSRADVAGTNTAAWVSTWRNTAAITSITVQFNTSSLTGVTVRLWGIA